MANFEIPENPGYDNRIRKVETTDLAHADLLNGMCGRIVENCEHLKKQGDGLREDFDNLLDEETIQVAQQTGFLSGGGGLTLLNGIIRLLLINPTVETGTDKNGFSYKKHANGEGEWRKKITFTTPEWSGQSSLHYCVVDVYEVPESVKEYDAIQFVVKDASGAQVHAATVSPYPDRMYFALSRVYGGTDAVKVTGHLIITGKWK